MSAAISKTHYNCGHPRTRLNSMNAGRGRLKCRTCKDEQRARRVVRIIGPRLKEQAGRCAICQRPMPKPNQDHNHKCCPSRRSGGNGPSGCVKCRRGLLCGGCNGGLHLVENEKLLKAAIAYLNFWK